MGVRDGDACASPLQHRQVVGHIAERNHLARVDAHAFTQRRERDGLGQARRADLDEVAAAVRDRERARVLAHDAQELRQRQRRMLDDQLGRSERAERERLGALHGFVQRVVRMLGLDRVVGLAAVARTRLDRERHVGEHAAERGHERMRVLELDGGLLGDAVAIQVVEDRAVAAQSEALNGSLLRDLAQAARWSRRDDDNRNARRSRRGERGECPRRHTAVTTQQRAVQVERE
jgi:hypothetical protein